MLLSYLCAHGAKLCDMDKAQKQQGRIVLFKEEKDGVAYVRIDYSDHPSIVLLLSQDGQVKWCTCGIPNPQGNTRYRKAIFRWMIHRVQLLEIRKHTCRMSVIEISYT